MSLGVVSHKNFVNFSDEWVSRMPIIRSDLVVGFLILMLVALYF